MFKKRPKSGVEPKSVEYLRVEAHLSPIISVLKTNKSARDSLAMALHNQQWIHLGDELSPKELMKAVLSRIEGDAREYNVFMHILRNTVGLESIAIRIQQTHAMSGIGPVNYGSTEERHSEQYDHRPGVVSGQSYYQGNLHEEVLQKEREAQQLSDIERYS
ncbi:hypothetical protein GBAR_LOCUS17871, partial [Geodia barretti]